MSLRAKALKKKTGIEFVSAEQDKVVDGLCPIRIEGCKAAVQKAVDIVIERFDGSLDKPPTKDKGKETLVQKLVVVTQQASSAHQPENKRNTTPFFPTTPPAAKVFIGDNSATTGGSKADKGLLLAQDNNMPLDPCSVVVALGARNLSEPADNKEKSFASVTVCDVLQKHENALKCTVSSFLQWLRSEDIECLQDFLDALTDDDVFKDMKHHGFKAFKRNLVLQDVKEQLKIMQQSSWNFLISRI